MTWQPVLGELELLLREIPLQKYDESWSIYFDSAGAVNPAFDISLGEKTYLGRNVVGYWNLEEADMTAWRWVDLPAGITFSFSLDSAVLPFMRKADLGLLKKDYAQQLLSKGLVLHPFWRLVVTEELTLSLEFFLKNQLAENPFTKR